MVEADDRFEPLCFGADGLQDGQDHSPSGTALRPAHARWLTLQHVSQHNRSPPSLHTWQWDSCSSTTSGLLVCFFRQANVWVCAIACSSMHSWHAHGSSAPSGVSELAILHASCQAQLQKSQQRSFPLWPHASQTRLCGLTCEHYARVRHHTP